MNENSGIIQTGGQSCHLEDDKRKWFSLLNLWVGLNVNFLCVEHMIAVFAFRLLPYLLIDRVWKKNWLQWSFFIIVARSSKELTTPLFEQLDSTARNLICGLYYKLVGHGLVYQTCKFFELSLSHSRYYFPKIAFLLAWLLVRLIKTDKKTFLNSALT